MSAVTGAESTLLKVSGWVLRLSNVQNFLLCLTGVFGLLWEMSRIANEIEDNNTGLPLLDARIFGYSPREAHTLVRDLGTVGRDKYLKITLYDMALPPLLAALLAIIIGPVYRRAGFWTSVNLFPLIYMAFDLAENLAIRYLLTGYPGWSTKVAFFAGELTRYKYRFFLYTLLVIGFGFIGLLKAKFTGSRPRVQSQPHRD